MKSFILRISVPALAALMSFSLCAQSVSSPSTGGLAVATFASPPTAITNQAFLFTDASATGVCTGGGTAKAVCVWNGSSFQAIAGTSVGLGDPGANSVVYRNGSGTSIPATATQMSGPNFCQDAGSSGAYACNLSPVIASYVTGTLYWFKANTANTGGASINLNSLGALTLVKMIGAITTSLAANDIRAGQWVACLYDGTNCEMASQLGTGVDLASTQTLTNKTVDGVSPTTFGFVDPTSSVQTQLNGKQATISVSANSILGNNTASPASPSSLTTAQTKTLLAIACADLTNAAASCATNALNASNLNAGLLGVTFGGSGANLSATGGAHNVLFQTTVGGAITVAQPAFTDISGNPTPAQLNLSTNDSILIRDNTGALNQLTAASIGVSNCVGVNGSPAQFTGLSCAGGGGSSTLTVANASSTGTTVSTLTKVTGTPSTAVIAATTDTNGIIGVTTSGAGTTGNATVTTAGSVSCVFDGGTTAGDYVQISSTTAGNCHDAGASKPTGGQLVGRVLSTNASGGTYTIDLFPSEIEGPVTTANLGAGMVIVGGKITLNTAFVPTITTLLQGDNTTVFSTTGTTAYVGSPVSGCSLAALKSGQIIWLIPDTTSTTSATFNFCSLGVKNIKKSDGVTDPGTTISANVAAPYQYDGTVWRQVGGSSGGASGVSSFSGDGTFATNSSSTGAVTLTLGTAGAHKAWMNNTGSTAAPGYESIGTADLPAALANQTSINGLAITASTGTLTIANAKTATINNTLTFTGTDSSSVAFGAGGTVLYTTGSGTGLTFPGTLSIASGKTLTASNTLTFTGADSSSVAFGGGGTVLYNSLTSANIFVGNGSNVATGVALTGDGGISNAGVLTLTQVNGSNFTVSSAGLVTKDDGIATVGTGHGIIGWDSALSNSSATSLVTLATAPTAGDYVAHYSLDLHTACTTGTEVLTVSFAWTGNSARAVQTGPWTIGSAQSTTSVFSGDVPLHVVSGNVTYTPSLGGTACATGTATWDGLVWLERVN